MNEPNMELHAQLLKVGHEIEKKTTHELEEVIIDGIIATYDVMGASQQLIQMIAFDLKIAKYKIFDWLGMMYTGRYISGESSDGMMFKIIEKMVEHYIVTSHVGGWAWGYRSHIDLEVELNSDKSYANGIHCQDCIDSYDEWHNQTDAERIEEQNERAKLYGGNIID